MCWKSMVPVGHPQGQNVSRYGQLPLCDQLLRVGQKCGFLGRPPPAAVRGFWAAPRATGRQKEGLGRHTPQQTVCWAWTFGLPMAFELPSQNCVRLELSRAGNLELVGGEQGLLQIILEWCAFCQAGSCVALMPPVFPHLPAPGRIWPGFSLRGARKVQRMEHRVRNQGTGIYPGSLAEQLESLSGRLYFLGLLQVRTSLQVVPYVFGRDSLKSR